MRHPRIVQTRQLGAVLVLCCLFIGIPHVFASETVGTIQIPYRYAWGDNLSWINFAPTDSGSTYHGLTITDTEVTGYAWSEIHGWINFSPDNAGVTNTCDGELGGYAWSEGLGWLSLSGAVIDENGVFTGVAGDASDPAGRVSFDCDSCDVRTDWRQCDVRSGGAVCGNGVVESGESCDTGGSLGACPASCSSACTANVCTTGGGASIPPVPPVVDDVQISTTSEDGIYEIDAIVTPNTYVDVFVDGVLQEPRGISQSDSRFSGELVLPPGEDHEISLRFTTQQGEQSVSETYRITVPRSSIPPGLNPDIPPPTSLGTPEDGVPPSIPGSRGGAELGGEPPDTGEASGSMCLPWIGESGICLFGGGMSPDTGLHRTRLFWIGAIIVILLFMWYGFRRKRTNNK